MATLDGGSRSQARIRATYMRGGTSKGVFFDRDELPAAVREAGALRDRFMLRLLGSPDPYERQIDGMGGATSSTSKVVLVSRSERDDCDVEFLFGAVAIERPVVDWSGNCGNLTAAVGPFAIERGLFAAPADGLATIRIWQANLGKRIHARVAMRGGNVAETGDFELDGVAFAAGEIQLDFLDPAGSGEEQVEGGALFPTGATRDVLDVDGLGPVEATLIDAGNPTVFVAAGAVGLTGTESPTEVNGRPELLARLEAVRARGAVAMGLAGSIDEATHSRPATPKVAFVAAPAAYRASSGRPVAADDIDVLVRIVSMGKLHHALTGTGAVALGVAAAIDGTVVFPLTAGGRTTRAGHPSGILRVGADVRRSGDGWAVGSVSLSRSARRLMDGWVFVPEDYLASNGRGS